MTTTVEKARNARGLATLAAIRSIQYRDAGSPRMAKFHAMKADEWEALADVLEEQAAFEATA